MPAVTDRAVSEPSAVSVSAPWEPSRWLIVLGTTVPLLASAFALVRFAGDYHPTGDFASSELHVRDIGRYAVLLGPYSRDDWYHPGPTFFYLAAIPYRLMLSSSLGMLAAALCINGGSIAGMVLIARRRGGMTMMLATAICCALLSRALGGGFHFNPWNPYITVLPYAFLIYLAWAMTCGSTLALPMAAAVTTFLAQTHVGYVALAAPLFAWGACTLFVRWYRGRRRSSADSAEQDPVAGDPAPVSDRSAAIAVGATVALLFLLWLPPLIDQVSETGNLSTIVDFFRHPTEKTHSLTQAAKVLSEQFSIAPTWITGSRSQNFLGEPQSMYEPSVPLLLVAIVAAGIFLWRKGPSVSRRFIGVLGVAFAAGAIAIARIPGPVSYYRMYWTWVLGAATGVVVLWALAAYLRDRRPVGRWVSVAAVAGLVALCAANAIAAMRADTPEPNMSRVMADLRTAIEDDLPASDVQIVIKSNSFVTIGATSGVVRALEADGYDVRVDSFVTTIGSHRLASDEPRATYMLADPGNLATFVNDPTMKFLAFRFYPRESKLGLEPEHSWHVGTPLDQEYLATIIGAGTDGYFGVAVFRVN